VVDAIVFDLDGVLIDSEPVWEEVRRQYVSDHGGQWQPGTQSRLMGMSTGEWARYLSDELGVGRTAEQVAGDVVTEMVARYTASVPLIPGADAVVRELARAWPLGLASASPPRLIEAALTVSGLADTFEVALSADGVPRGKPAADIYLAVAKRLGQDPALCVAIEDSSNGVRSAARAGMKVIAVPDHRYPLDDDAQQRAGLVVAGLDAISPEAVRAVGRGT
jgi:HAD superfamily hydrolase (TIGR01509 family)